MKPGEIIVVRLNHGPGLGRCIEADASRVRVAIGRNREARLPLSRVLLECGVPASGHETVEALLQDAETVAACLDLEELWKLICDEGDTFALDDIAELLWTAPPTPAQRVGLLLHLDRNDLRFAKKGASYLPRPREEVDERSARQRRQAENAREEEALAASLAAGEPTPDPTPHQAQILDQLRGFALFGDDYTRVSSAKRFLQTVAPGSSDPQRSAFETLARAGLYSEDEFLDLERASVPDEFSDDALAEASAIDIAPLLASPGRTDLTHLNIFTIDDPGTEDRDDALSIEMVHSGDDAASDVSYRIGVHIADAGSVVKQGTVLDREADRRMSSLYLPERSISMLPPAIAGDMGSLVPGQRRLGLSVVARVTADGEVLDWEVAPSVLTNRAALTYQEVDAAIQDPQAALHEELSTLSTISRALRAKRESAGALNLDRDELSVKVAAAGDISVEVLRRSGAARGMVAEYMILCNTLLAEFCKQHELPAPYRSQKAPDLDDVIARTPEGPLRWYLTIRKMSPASISTESSTHGGLGVPAYIQASSPLRRYPDLVVQRQVSHFVETGQQLYTKEAIASVAQRAEVQLREIGRLEEERKKYWFLKYLEQRRQASQNGDGENLYDAIVLDAPPNRAGVLELVQYPFRVRAAIPSTVSPGETVCLRLHGVDLWRRVGQFVVAQ